MTITLPDFSNFSFAQQVLAAFLIAFADVAWNSVVALSRNQFSATYLTDFLRTHVILKITPIVFGAALAAGLLGLPAVSQLAIIVDLMLAAYFVNTAQSMIDGWKDASPPTAIVAEALTTLSSPPVLTEPVTTVPPVPPAG